MEKLTLNKTAEMSKIIMPGILLEAMPVLLDDFYIDRKKQFSNTFRGLGGQHG